MDNELEEQLNIFIDNLSVIADGNLSEKMDYKRDRDIKRNVSKEASLKRYL